jgi:hypothetical protein
MHIALSLEAVVHKWLIIEISLDLAAQHSDSQPNAVLHVSSQPFGHSHFRRVFILNVTEDRIV